MLDQLLAGRHVASRVHRIHSTAFRIYVCEGWQSSIGNITEELCSVDKLIHGVLLRPLHQRLDLALMCAREKRLNIPSYLIHKCINNVRFVILYSKESAHVNQHIERVIPTFFHVMFFSSKIWKTDLVQLVPVTLAKNPAD